MIPIFSHYVPTRLMFLAGLEVLVLLLAAYLGGTLVSSGAAGGAFAAVSGYALLFAVSMLMVMSSMGLYQPESWQSTASVGGRLVAAFLLGSCAAGIVSYFVPVIRFDPYALGSAAALALVGTGLVRMAFSKWGSLGVFKSRVLVLGTGSRVMRLAEFAQRSSNHVVVGYVSLQPAKHYIPLPHVLTLAPGETLAALAEHHGIDEIVIAVRDRRGGGFPMQDLLQCRLKGIKVTELATFFEREHRQLLLESLNPSWMVLGDGFRQGFVRRTGKRLFDLAVSLLLLVLAAPVMLLTALLIFVESGLPILYRQERVGEGGRTFTVYKFRSMAHDAEHDGKPRWAANDDDRTTGVGRIIRKLRIDELPQIINVLKGDMSFVGPRPERPYFVEQLTGQIPYYALRHCVKPGISGWAQVRYPYGASVDDAIEKLQYDLYYVKNHCLFLDFVILIDTVRVVLWGKGAR